MKIFALVVILENQSLCIVLSQSALCEVTVSNPTGRLVNVTSKMVVRLLFNSLFQGFL